MRQIRQDIVRGLLEMAGWLGGIALMMTAIGIVLGIGWLAIYKPFIGVPVAVLVTAKIVGEGTRARANKS